MLFAFIVASTLFPASQDPSRPSTPSIPPANDHRTEAEPSCVRPALERALAHVHRFELRCLELGLLGELGRPNPRVFERATEELVAFLEGSERDLFPGLGAFAFSTKDATLQQIIECGRYHAGFRAFERALREDPHMGPADVLAGLSDAMLTAPPRSGSEQAQRFWTRGREQRRLAPLGPGSFCYVAWGALVTPKFWASRGRAAREKFISTVLRRIPATEIQSWTCQRVLQIPLAWTDDRPARGIATARALTRGELGFTAADQDWMTETRTAILSGEPIETEAGAERIEEWSRTMLDRILRERGAALIADERLRRGTLAERKRYWSDLANERPFEDFRAAFLAELYTIAAGADAFPRSDRMIALEEKEAARTLTDAERAELAGSRRRLDTARCDLVGHMAKMLATNAGEIHYAAAAAVLAGPAEHALVTVGAPAERETALAHGWVQLGVTPSPQSIWVVEAHLQGSAPIPRRGVQAIVGMLSLHKPPGWEGTMDAAFQSDDRAAREIAIANPGWMSEERYGAEFDRLLGDLSNEGLSADERSSLRACLIASLADESQPAGRSRLLKSFEDGLWSESAGEGSWVHATSRATRRRVLARLSEEERREFVERGLVSGGVFD